MKKMELLLILIICSISLSGCEFSFNDLLSGSGNSFETAFDEKINGVTNQIEESIDDKISETVDQVKDEMTEKAEDALAEEFSEIQDGIMDNIGIQVDKLVEYKPGIWFENESIVSYEKNGLKMNAFWEKEEKSDKIAIAEGTFTSTVPEGAIVTISFFENLPETVTIFELKDGIEEAIEVSEMTNPLTGKATYSFSVLYEQEETKEYIIQGTFKEIDACLFKAIFYKK